MGWSTSAPSGVTFADSTSVTVVKTWNYWKLTLTVWTARKTNGGNTFYLKVKAKWTVGSMGSYNREPGYYWQCTSGSESVSEKEQFYARPDSEGTQYRYYSGTRASGADNVSVRLSASQSYASVDTLAAAAELAAATYAVSYKANGGSGTTSAQTKTYGESLTLRSGGFSRTGYTFTGWNTAADGSGTAYAAGGTYSANAAATLYAQWSINTYAVTYAANGGSGTTSAQTKTYGVSLTLRSSGFTRTGYTFTGWNTAANGSGTAYAAGGTYTANAAVKLYAQWAKDQPDMAAWANVDNTVKQLEKAFVNAGGTVKEAEIYVNAGGTVKKI